ncbi:MAG: M15 family metallopeptidase [Actinomycetia bacterium]|nr:M15 family metallopeptidase [Actinomycetes bacterium]
MPQRRNVALGLLVVMGVAAGCSGPESTTTPVAQFAAEANPTSTTTTPTKPVPNTTMVTVPPTAPTTTVPPSTTVPPTTTQTPRFTSSIDTVTAADLGVTYRQGCPVGPDQLRLVTVVHWTPDGDHTTGSVVVHEMVAEDIAHVFAVLFESNFAIERLEPIQAFDGDDDKSMAANNTSAFNCREVAWRPGVWSLHAYGRAIDINPLVNPYVSTKRLLPPEGAEFADRSLETPGMIRDDDAVVTAFTEIGWTWGGHWSSAKDYQHFDLR